jgi:hypothetical protein
MVHDEITLNTLLAICFTVFTLVVTIQPGLLRNTFLSLQLILSIPLLISSIHARIKMSYNRDAKKWDQFGFITFIIAYSFLINSVGILLGYFVGASIIITFFIVNIILAVIYSAIKVSYDSREYHKRIIEDGMFVLLLLLLGMLPALGVY